MTSCPACRKDIQENLTECPYCSVIFSKWEAYECSRVGNLSSFPQSKINARKNLLILSVLFIALTCAVVLVTGESLLAALPVLGLIPIIVWKTVKGNPRYYGFAKLLGGVSMLRIWVHIIAVIPVIAVALAFHHRLDQMLRFKKDYWPNGQLWRTWDEKEGTLTEYFPGRQDMQ